MTINAASKPQLSVVLATPDTYQTIRTTVSYLNKQTICDRLELVIVCRSKDDLELPAADLQNFAAYQIVEIGPLPSVSFANAAGVRQATAEIVALAETHAFPEPNWAEVLVAAHQEDWAAVGPAIVNANPKSLVSWASFLIAYSQWMPPITSGPKTDLPGHNSSYKRELLLERYNHQLDTMLETESILHWDLQQAGYQIYLAAEAQTRHMNPSIFTSYLSELFYYGRLFAAARAENWSWLRRIVYMAASVLIPLVRLKHTLPQISRAKQHYAVPSPVLPVILVGLVVASFGEMLGYALGAGKAMEQMREFEYHRDQHVLVQDRLSMVS